MRRPHHYSYSPDAFSLRAQFQLASFTSPKKHHQRPYHSSPRKPHYHRDPIPSYYPQPPSPQKPYLSTLPPELKLMVHESLDPVSSTCLGLSSREFYPTHKHLHKKVGLYDRGDKLPLCMYLKEWAPEGYGLDWRTERFVGDKRRWGHEGAGERRGDKRREREREYLGSRLRRSRKYERLDVQSYRWWR